jgi:cytochrome c peroxidase
MHDGRFATLEEVVSHYSDNIADHENLASELQDWNLGGPMRLNLSTEQKSALVSFLGTLTDADLVREEKYADPFLQ